MSWGRSRLDAEFVRLNLCGGLWVVRMSLSPQLVCEGDWIDTRSCPSLLLFNRAMDLPMMRAAERHRELIADLAAECPGLCEA